MVVDLRQLAEDQNALTAKGKARVNNLGEAKIYLKDDEGIDGAEATRAEFVSDRLNNLTQGEMEEYANYTEDGNVLPC